MGFGGGAGFKKRKLILLTCVSLSSFLRLLSLSMSSGERGGRYFSRSAGDTELRCWAHTTRHDLVGCVGGWRTEKGSLYKYHGNNKIEKRICG